MTTPGRNDPCPYGSGKKFEECCINKKPRKKVVMVGSAEPLLGLHYDKEKMEFKGITHDGRTIETDVTFSQTHYMADSGKERAISRIHDKVVPHQPVLFRHLSSSFDVLIGIDTNSKPIGTEIFSVSGIIHSVLTKSDPNSYHADFPWNGAILFRNCPS